MLRWSPERKNLPSCFIPLDHCVGYAGENANPDAISMTAGERFSCRAELTCSPFLRSTLCTEPQEYVAHSLGRVSCEIATLSVVRWDIRSREQTSVLSKNGREVLVRILWEDAQTTQKIRLGVLHLLPTTVTDPSLNYRKIISFCAQPHDV